VTTDVSTVFDLAIMGGGSAGYAAALRGAPLGLQLRRLAR
jgi:dihydrolipoamide dehydrogenase